MRPKITIDPVSFSEPITLILIDNRYRIALRSLKTSFTLNTFWVIDDVHRVTSS